MRPHFVNAVYASERIRKPCSHQAETQSTLITHRVWELTVRCPQNVKKGNLYRKDF